MTAASMWAAHVAQTIDRLTNHPDDRPDPTPNYVGRHQHINQPSGLNSVVARLRVDAQRATLAQFVLAATDDLPASRELYRQLLRAGALTSGLRGVA